MNDELPPGFQVIGGPQDDDELPPGFKVMPQAPSMGRALRGEEAPTQPPKDGASLLPEWAQTAHKYLNPEYAFGGKLGVLSMALPAGRAPTVPMSGPIPEAASRLGVEIPNASLRGRITQSVAQKLSQVPFVGTPLETQALKAEGQLGAAANRVAEGYGGVSAPTAGSAARDSIKKYMTSLTEAEQSRLYGDVAKRLNPNVGVPLNNTMTRINQINAERANAGLPPSDAIKLVEDAATRPQGMNFEGIKRLRTNLGQRTNYNREPLPSDMTDAEKKLLYGGLSEDLRASVQHGGPNAIAAFEKANSYSASIAKQRENLFRIVNAKSEEGVVDRILASASAKSRADYKLLTDARAAMDPQAWEGISSAAVSRLGRGPGGEFSADRFVSDWGKLSPQGKAILFRSTGKNDLAKSLDDIATVSQQFKQYKGYFNSSKTAPAAAVIGGLGGTAYATYTGDWQTPLKAAATVLSGRAVSHMLARPATAKALSVWANAYAKNPKVLPVAAKALSMAIAEEFGGDSPGAIQRMIVELSKRQEESGE